MADTSPHSGKITKCLFLDLPWQIRVRICLFVPNGILGQRTQSRLINLGNPSAPDRNHDRQRFINTYRLLLTCKTVYGEVSRLLYTFNQFFVEHWSLPSLRSLRPDSLKVLRRLTIHINVVTCGMGDGCLKCGYPWEADSCNNSSKPLSLANARDKNLINDWLSTWDSIAPYLEREDQMTLHFICDVADATTGIEVLRPFLHGSPPSLAACSIRLSHQGDKQLRDLACAAVKATTSKRNGDTSPCDRIACSHFRFLDLPPEIRERILCYTNLVTPFREVEWNPQHGFYFRYKFVGGPRNSSPHQMHGYPIEPMNGERSVAWKQSRTSYLRCWERTYPNGCFCKAYHAAESSVFRCACWSPPTPLFLVNHEMREDTLRVFYTRNRFVVTSEGGVTWYGVDSPPERLPVSTFLSTVVPPDALRHLRSVEIVFPACGVTRPGAYCPAQSAQWEDWTLTVENAKDQLNLCKLTIRVYFAEWLPKDPTKIPVYRLSMTEEQANAELDLYFDTLSPLRRLTGLAKFFAHVSDPTAWTEDRPQLRDLEELERELERSVMGEQYDAVAAGKNDMAESRWAEDLEIHAHFGSSIE